MRLSKRTLLAAVLTVTLVSTGAVVIWLDSGDDHHRSEATHGQLFGFALFLSAWSQDHDRIPGPGLADASNVLLADEVYSAKVTNCRLVLQGHDAWGRKFIYEVDKDGRRAVIRSLGANGKDEHGAGDDIQEEVILLFEDGCVGSASRQ